MNADQRRLLKALRKLKTCDPIANQDSKYHSVCNGIDNALDYVDGLACSVEKVIPLEAAETLYHEELADGSFYSESKE